MAKKAAGDGISAKKPMFFKIVAKYHQNKRLYLFRNPFKVRKITFKNNSIAKYSHPVSPNQSLFDMFEKCINFILPSGFTAYEDVDSIVRRFSTFGKVQSIHNHWIQPRGMF